MRENFFHSIFLIKSIIMSHFAGLGLENFRTFPRRVDMEFAPITVLTGTNGRGKSSVVRALKLIQSNFQQLSGYFDFFDTLDFRKVEHQLGNFETSR